MTWFESVEDVSLCGWYDPVESDAYTTVKAHLFNAMMERFVTKHYMGDMFHDALWLDSMLSAPQWNGAPFTFVWITREWGTHIGTIVDNATSVYWAWMQNPGADTYVVTLWNSSEGDPGSGHTGYWHATFAKLQKLPGRNQ